MSKAKFAAAKELIDEKKYDEARSILKTIDHPTAREWEARLDQIAPPFQPPALVIQEKTKTPPKRINPITLILLTAAVFIILTLTRPTESPSQSSPTSTQDLTKVALLKGTATVLALTPSATITETPLPSRTPTLAPTDIPPTQIQGTKGNPYPIQTTGAIRDGRFRVNNVLIHQTQNVKTQNQFNSDPPAGGEYVLANVTFFCDLQSDKTCNVTVMDLNLVGKLGAVYNRELFISLDNSFSGEVFGGGETSGDIAFIVKSNDSDYIVAVNDLGNRTFFAGK